LGKLCLHLGTKVQKNVCFPFAEKAFLDKP
jgi:hypothetical protein